MSLPGAAHHEGSTAGPTELAKVLGEAHAALRAGDVPYVLIGGLASSSWGRPRCSSDIDLLLDARDADRGLDALGAAGFDTERTNPNWLYKAFRSHVLVDLLFKSKGDFYLDAEMLRRASVREVCGHAVPVIAAEDLIVMKALVHDEETPRHWFDALSLLASVPLDWEYLLERARLGPHRVASLVSYGRSLGLAVPGDALDALHGLARGDLATARRAR